MIIDPQNKIVQLSSKGMQKEAEFETAEARKIFEEAWRVASNNFEKSIAAHYVARHQDTVKEKLYWDELALSLALKNDYKQTEQILPSLYLNIGKCYEDLGSFCGAKENYDKANFLADSLQDSGYGNMIKSAIKAGLARVSEKKNGHHPMPTL
jgi:rifampin ADP-ribosylating transferase